jgi:hypothetical protein
VPAKIAVMTNVKKAKIQIANPRSPAKDLMLGSLHLLYLPNPTLLSACLVEVLAVALAC